MENEWRSEGDSMGLKKVSELLSLRQKGGGMDDKKKIIVYEYCLLNRRRGIEPNATLSEKGEIRFEKKTRISVLTKYRTVSLFVYVTCFHS